MANIKLAKRVIEIEASKTIMMNLRARELKERGVDIIDLTVGEPDFMTPLQIRELAKKDIDIGYNKYTAVSGYTELKDAVCKKLSRENNLNYKTEEIMISNGAKHCLCNAIFSIINEGDEVIIPSPHWVSYSELVKLAGGLVLSLKCEAKNGYKIDFEKLSSLINSKTKAIILCSPSNPTGSVLNKADLENLAYLAKKYPNFCFISDEVYEHINYSGQHLSIANIKDMKERTILINGISKAYAMTGWRIGYMAAEANLIQACIKLQGQMTSNASSISQRAALAAINSGTSLILEMQVCFKKRKDLIMSLIRGNNNIDCFEPEGAFYIFPNFSKYYGKKTSDNKKIENSNDLSEYLLDKAHVATVPGVAFGDDSSIRISFAGSESILERGIKKIFLALEELS